jgi:hypothetical protein
MINLSPRHFISHSRLRKRDKDLMAKYVYNSQKLSENADIILDYLVRILHIVTIFRIII